MTTIFPTGTCFDDAIEQFGVLLDANKHAMLVHAICVGDDGTRYAHAWVEEGGTAWDSGVLADGRRLAYAVPVLEFYSARRVEQKWRYSPLEMLRANRKHGTYGPWEPELVALCGNGGRVVGSVQATWRGR